MIADILAPSFASPSTAIVLKTNNERVFVIRK